MGPRGTRTRRAAAVLLLVTGHPAPAALLAVALGVAAALTGRDLAGSALVTLTVLVGQLVVGWVDDVVDRQRDREVSRPDKPVARGWLDTGTVLFAAACGVLLVVPLSVSHGTTAGLAHLLALAALVVARVWPTAEPWAWLSWLPWAAGYGLLPAFLAYAEPAWGSAPPPAAPTWTMTVLAALLGVGVHLVLALPDLVEDRATGTHHLPLLVALRTGAPRLLWITTAYLVLVAAAMFAAALAVGLRQ